MDATIAKRRTMGRPRPKIAAVGIGGAGSTLIVWTLAVFGLKPTPELAAALTTLIAFAAGYAFREGGGG